MHPVATIEERIIEGRRMLVRITGEDYGYDLQKWHNHLKESREGGYTWQRNINLPKIMKEAIASEQWNAAVQTLPAEIEIEPLKKIPPTEAERRRIRKMQRHAD